MILREEDSNQYYLPKTTAFIVLFILFYAVCLTFSVFAFFFWSLFVLLIVSFALTSFGSYKLYFCFLRVSLENLTYILSPTKSKVNNNFLLLFLLFSRSVVSDTLQPQWTAACQALLFSAAAKSLQSCSTLCDPTDGSPPGSPVPGILQARTLEWVPFPSPTRESEK